jgi:DNA-binding NarL/FixJ family response regulator
MRSYVSKGIFPTPMYLSFRCNSDEEYIVRALRCGASAYVLKDAAVVELELALKSVARGNIFLGPSMHRQICRRMLS